MDMPVAEKRFRIAFSFAGEVRDFVEKTAHILAAQFGQEKILYDEFHGPEFARWNLGIYLPKLYGEQSDLIVVVLSPAYDEKRWTGWEWMHIYGLLTKADGHRVLTSRFEYAQADGLSPAAGFMELDGKTEEQFAELILERLALNEGKPRDHYKKLTAEIPPYTTIRHNLPALQPFFGREAELKTIAEALEPESRTWGAIIDGPGGMGKTSLAVRAALNASPEVFDRIVFISLKPRELDDDGIRDLSGFLISGLAELLNELARELGRDDIPKAVEEERPKRLIEALRNQRVLLILDNLESLVKKERDIVFNLMKRLPSGCKAILTSSVRIGSAAEELILAQLNEEATLELLADIAKRNPALAKSSMEDSRQIWQVTGGNPLLIRWTAGQVGRGKCLTLNDALAYLRTCPAGNDPLEFIFGDLVEDFSSAETKALCALTYFTLPAKTKHLATVGECSEEEMDEALRSLINRSFVRPDEEVTSFTLIPLVADYLRKKRPEVIVETGNLLEKGAYALVVENGYQKYECFPVLEESWSMVAAALPLFVQGANGRLQRVCNALHSFLDFSGRWDEGMKLFTDAEKRAVAEGDFQNAGWRACHTGYIYYLRVQSTEVLARATQAEEYFGKENADNRGRAFAIRLKGIGYEMNQEYKKAAEAYQESLQLYHALGEDKEDMAIILNDLGGVMQSLQQYDAAEKYYYEAMRIAKTIRDEYGIASYTGNLAALKLIQKDLLVAEQLARVAVVMSEKIGSMGKMATQFLTLGEILQQRGRPKEALPFFEKGGAIFERLGNANGAEKAKELIRRTQIMTRHLLIESLELINICCFEKLAISFMEGDAPSPVSILLGENASGKSTILRCIVVGLCNEGDAAALIAAFSGEFVRQDMQEGEIKIKLKRSHSEDRYSISTKILKVSKAVRASTTGGISEYLIKETNPKVDFPWADIFLCGYGTSRTVMGTLSYDEYNLRHSAGTLFSDKTTLWNPEVVLLRQSEAIRREIEKSLSNVLMIDPDSLAIDSQSGQPIISGKWGKSSIKDLSDGYRSTTQWLLDMCAWSILEDGYDAKWGVLGILLVDELEQHLHPQWQRYFLQILRNQFPYLQIITTTHTPLIVGGCADIEDSKVFHLNRDLDGDNIISLIDRVFLRGKRADQILASDAFGLPTSRSPGHSDAVAQYTELSSKKRSEQEEIRYQELAKRLDSDLRSGETETQRIIEEAVEETLRKKLNEALTGPMKVELRKQLNEIFGKEDAQ